MSIINSIIAEGMAKMQSINSSDDLYLIIYESADAYIAIIKDIDNGYKLINVRNGCTIYVTVLSISNVNQIVNNINFDCRFCELYCGRNIINRRAIREHYGMK